MVEEDSDTDSDSDQDSGVVETIACIMLDIVVRVKEDSTTTGKTGRAAANRPDPVNVLVTVRDLVIEEDAEDDSTTKKYFLMDPTKIYEQLEPIPYQYFGINCRVGHIRRALQEVYMEDGLGDKVGKKSALFLRTNFQHKAKMEKIKKSRDLVSRLHYLMKRGESQFNKFVCKSINGVRTMTIDLALGYKKDDDEVMSVLSDSGDTSDEDAEKEADGMFSQDMSKASQSPLKKRRKRATGRREGRASTRSSTNEVLFIWRKYYLAEDSPYRHKLSKEMYNVICNEYENESTSRKDLIDKLNSGEYPSLNWMNQFNLIDPSIWPGQKEWPPTQDKRGWIPPYAIPREKPSNRSSNKRNDEALNSLLTEIKKVNETTKGGVQFIRDEFHVSLCSATCAECRTGKDLLDKALEAAEEDRIPIFRYRSDVLADLKSKRKELEYRFNGMRMKSNGFKKTPTSSITLGSKTVDIVVAVVAAPDPSPWTSEYGAFIY